MATRDKIRALPELAEELARQRARGRRVVLCHGVFDLLHLGHVRYFERAKEHGQVLVVTLTPDRFVDKGPGRPAFPEGLRAEFIAALEVVDYVAINQWPTAEETLRGLRPHVYAKGAEFKAIGDDYTGKIGREAEVARELGVEVVFTEDIVFSSSTLLNRYLSDQPPEAKSFLDRVRGQGGYERLHQLVDRLGSLRVLVAGDCFLQGSVRLFPQGGLAAPGGKVFSHLDGGLTWSGALSLARLVASLAGATTLLAYAGGAGEPDPPLPGRAEGLAWEIISGQEPGAGPARPAAAERTWQLSPAAAAPARAMAAMAQRLGELAAGHDLLLYYEAGGGLAGPALSALAGSRPFLCLGLDRIPAQAPGLSRAEAPPPDYLFLDKAAGPAVAAGPAGGVWGPTPSPRLALSQGSSGWLLSVAGEETAIPRLEGKRAYGSGQEAFFALSSLAARLGASNLETGLLGAAAAALLAHQGGSGAGLEPLAFKKYLVSLLK